MRILQVTNIVSHHQMPLAIELARLVGENNFRLAAMDGRDPARSRLGWHDDYSQPWILRTAESKSDREELDEWWSDADVVLCGQREFDRMARRLSYGKLCFYMSERWWKPPLGQLRLLSPSFLRLAYRLRSISQEDSFYYLAIGPFAARDLRQVASKRLKVLQWGYFPPQSVLSPDRELLTKVGSRKVLWLGRMLRWKRIDVLIRAIATLQQQGNDVLLTLMGDGPDRSRIVALASSILMPGTWSIHDPVRSDMVQHVMAEHQIYVLPSSAYEGWGAVVNEAMQMGMVVVSSDAVGSACTMIQDDFNGVLFRSGDADHLAECLTRILAGGRGIDRMRTEARRTIRELWSPEVAAKRLVEVSRAIASGCKPPMYGQGPLCCAGRW